MDLLSELAGLEVADLAVVDDRAGRLVDIQQVGLGVVVIAGDRDQSRKAQVPFQLHRLAVVLVVGLGLEVVGEVGVLRTHVDAGLEDRRRDGRVAAQGGVGRQRDERPADRGPAVHIVPAEGGGEVRRWGPQQLAVQGAEVAAARLVASEDVVHVAFEIVVVGAEPALELVGDDRSGNRAADAVFIVGGGERVQVARQGRGGRAGGDVDQAGGGRLAIEGALRTAQHLDVVDVRQVGEGPGLEGHRHIVHLDRDRRLDADREREGADAADRDRGIDRLFGRSDHQRRRKLGQVGEFPDAGRSQLVRTHHLHRLRNVLDVLGALLGGDDDLVHRGASAAWAAPAPPAAISAGDEPAGQRCARKQAPHSFLPLVRRALRPPRSNWSYHIGKAAHNHWYVRKMKSGRPGRPAPQGRSRRLAVIGLTR